MAIYNPPHPGRIVQEECLEALTLNITKGAEILKVTRQTLSNLINGKSGISPEMAIRLSKAFGSSPEVWLKMQMQYDLFMAQKHMDAIDVKRYMPNEKLIHNFGG